MTPRTLGAVAAALLTMAACSEKKAPARPPPPPPPPPPAAAAEIKHEAPGGDWSYSSVGKRDPFRSFLAELAANTTAPVTRCITPLGRFDIDQLKLVAVVTGLEDPVAMAEAPNGIGYALRRGACIGRNGGVISAVRTGEVVIAEWIVRADGTRERTQVLLRLPKEPALDIEE